jgi:glycolate oxidase FAD binding subunit
LATTTETLSLAETVSPEDQPGLIATMREAHAAKKAIYPLGGQTSLDYGLPAKQPGLGISLQSLTRVVDYPARDMTITVEAGVTMSALAELLAKERQRVPLDVPEPDRATIGGVIATNWSGPLRFGHGTVRDYVIGISAVDGRGTPFKGGGRVVKNVAGYDFCKLLVGSLGTLGVISQVTLKLKPIPQRTALVACRVSSSEHAERLLSGLITSRTTPVAVELLAGPVWHDASAIPPLVENDFGYLMVALEGTPIEVDWMLATLAAEWQALDAQAQTLTAEEAQGLWRQLREFAAQPAALVVKLNVPPSKTVETIGLLREIDAGCSIQAHAGNGIVVCRFASFPGGGVSRTVVGRLQPAAQNAGGSCVILSCSQPGEMTRQAVWGAAQDAAMLMEAVKRQFDPANQLNPGRFVYANL